MVFLAFIEKNFHVLGDGGIIVTNKKKLFDKLSLMRNHGLKIEMNQLFGNKFKVGQLAGQFWKYNDKPN